MSEMLSPTLLFALGLFAALWLLAGLWAGGRGGEMQRRSAFVAGQTDRLASLIEASSQLPVVVRAVWRGVASVRLGLVLVLVRGPRLFFVGGGEVESKRLSSTTFVASLFPC